jgi:tRNA dimethylallyltransferase
MAKLEHKVLFIVGPTASGKTQLSVEIAKAIGNAEIISADSRQIYKFLDVGTAKPSEELLHTIPHHFIDLYDPDVNYNAGKYSKEARIVTQQLIDGKVFPVVVGGSGLYVKALTDGFSLENINDARVRVALRQRLDQEGAESLYKQLQIVDPELAKSIHPNNTQRIMRSLEIYILTGKTQQSYTHKTNNQADFYPVFFGLEWERDQLYHNIDRRVDEMILEGLIAEVAVLSRRGYDESLNSLQTVGYKEVYSYFKGEINYQEMIALIKKNSRNYAKRQLTWFKNDDRVNWVKVNNTTNFVNLAKEIIQTFNEVDIPENYTATALVESQT